jgi:uncharacterized protein YodC (DUF2158 family)
VTIVAAITGVDELPSRPTFQIGDQVRLKAMGSRRMIVWKIEVTGDFLCEWFDEGKELKSKAFSSAELENWPFVAVRTRPLVR